MTISETNCVFVEDNDLYGWQITGYPDFTEIQYYEYENKVRKNLNEPILFGAGEISEKIAKAILKVNVKD